MAKAKKKLAKKRVPESEWEAQDLKPKTGKKHWVWRVTLRTGEVVSFRARHPDLSQAAEKYQGLKTERMEVLEEEAE